jgi:hypothetical protein
MTPDDIQRLGAQLAAARQQSEDARARNQDGEQLHAPNIGQHITAAYEQLRNSAEYTEDHLLLQHAIRRFYYRNFSFFVHKRIRPRLAEELIVELTQAGYLPNDSFSRDTAGQIQSWSERSYQTFWDLRRHHVPREIAIEWTLDILSANVESLLNPHQDIYALAYFAFRHFQALFADEPIARSQGEQESYEICLYLAVHQTLLKSDSGFARHDLVRLYQISPDDIQAFISFNRQMNQLWQAPLTRTLHRAINKYAAPLRILQNMMEERGDLPELLANRAQFLEAFDYQTAKEYGQLKTRLKAGLTKSIVFILITKVLIGVAVEVPYDLVTRGLIVWTPLIINLLTPPAYMASLKLGIKNPTQTNAEALHRYIDRTLFTGEPPVAAPLRVAPKRTSTGTQFFYTIMFLLPMVIVGFVLMLLHFNIVQGVIFYVFISTASFLGFRLSRMVRELELVTHEQKILATIGDFFYLPFILTGRWLSAKYAKVNAVARLLDMAIELPLKSALRLMRQWVSFLNEKHEEIY